MVLSRRSVRGAMVAWMVAASAAWANPAPWTERLWDSARLGDKAQFETLLRDHAAAPPAVAESAASLVAHLDAREAARAERIAEVREEMAEALEKGQDALALADAMRHAIELYVLLPDKPGFLAEAGIRDLLTKAERAARDAEANGDVLSASQLFVYLNELREDTGQFKGDVRRMNMRLEMLRMYAPRRLWELRNERNIAQGEKPLPPYNALGEGFAKKLEGVDQLLIERAIARATRHVERVPVTAMTLGGIEAVRTMVTTPDLASAFPGLADADARTRMAKTLDVVRDRVAADDVLDALELKQVLDSIAEANDATTRIDRAAWLHEFGVGSMGRLDEFSAFIWPEDVARFNRTTQGRFVGVGVQIEHDELQNVRVVTPLEGTPAQRAGVHTGDLITKVDGRSIYGLSLDQVVDVITGPEGTPVTITVERREVESAAATTTDAPPGDAPEADEVPAREIQFTLTRSVIPIFTVKGWERQGAREDAWNWFVDREAGIGYVRLTQFSDNTMRELFTAVGQMQQAGMRGLILDLRFNPGGLLDQAVEISRAFVPVRDGLIVAMSDGSGRLSDPTNAVPEQAVLARTPVVVLINEGSASASEIVSGAIRHYGTRRAIDAIVLGARSFGKGSVQNVFQLSNTTLMRLTTAYYTLPDGSIIHRRPGAAAWGVEPMLGVEMLPKQNSDAILLRRNADVIPLNENGVVQQATDRPNPSDLLTKGIDLQLQAAVVLLKARTMPSVAQLDREPSVAQP